MSFCSYRTYPVRAKKRLIQDEVHNLVIGIRQDCSSGDEVLSTGDGMVDQVISFFTLQAGQGIDRYEL